MGMGGAHVRGVDDVEGVEFEGGEMVLRVLSGDFEDVFGDLFEILKFFNEFFNGFFWILKDF
jgi:hypothetical protein